MSQDRQVSSSGPPPAQKDVAIEQAQEEEARGYLRVYRVRSRWQILRDDFFGGIAWGLGGMFGAALFASIIAVLIKLLEIFGRIPAVGPWLEENIIRVVVEAIRAATQS